MSDEKFPRLKKRWAEGEGRLEEGGESSLKELNVGVSLTRSLGVTNEKVAMKKEKAREREER